MNRSEIVAYAAPARPTPEPLHRAHGEQRSASIPTASIALGLLLEAPTLTPASLSAWSLPRLWTW